MTNSRSVRFASIASFFTVLGFLLITGCIPEPYYATPPLREGKIQLIVRVDDIGILHTTNQVAQSLLQNSIATDFSVVVNTNWFPEIANVLRQEPDWSMGVQLTLASPWQNYKWSPLSHEPIAEFLWDPMGYFKPTFSPLQDHGLDSLAVIQEFRKQVQKARGAGLDIAYLHLPEPAQAYPAWMTHILEQLAFDFQVGITGYFDERPTPAVTGTTYKDVEKSMIEVLNGLGKGRWCLAVPAGDRTPEFYSAGLPDTSEVSLRANLVRALRSNIIAALCAERGIELVSYRRLLQRAGLWRQRTTLK